ncbi:MAG: hypothetical protein WC728_12335 [Elusimicrobiota bacterium]
MKRTPRAGLGLARAVLGALALSLAGQAEAQTLVLRSSSTYDVGADASESVRALAVHPSGFIYAAGISHVWIGKYTPDSVLIASAVVSGTNGAMDRAEGIAVGPDGNLYVTGRIDNTVPGVQAYVGKFSPELVLLASATFNGTGGATSANLGYAIFVDETGVYLAGGTQDATEDFWVARLGYDLVLVSSATIATGSTERAYDIVQKSGVVYSVGQTTSGDFLASRFAGDMVLLSSRVITAGDATNFRPHVLADSSGNMYVAASTGNPTQRAVWMLKYDASFSTAAAATFDINASYDDRAHDLAWDPQGNIYLTGEYSSGGPANVFILKVSNSFALISSTTVSDGIEKHGYAIAVSPDGLVRLGGNANVNAMYFGSYSQYPNSAITNPGTPYASMLANVAGTAEAAAGYNITQVQFSVKRNSDNQYWNGTAWGASQTFLNPSFTGMSSGTWVLATGSLGTSLTNGTSYLIESKATDGSGTQSPFGQKTFLYDNVLPAAAILFPANNSARTDFPLISGTANDVLSPIVGVRVRISSSPNYNTYWSGDLLQWQASSTYTATTPGASWTYSQVPSGNDLVSMTTYQISLMVMDMAGNVNNSVTSQFYYNRGSPRGRYLSSAPDGYLWEIIRDNVDTWVSRFSPTGVFISSVVLPYASTQTDSWSTVFSNTGDVYVVGSSSGPMTQAMDAVVYKFPSTGDVIISSTGYDSSYHLDDFATYSTADASGNIWIGAGIQTGAGYQYKMGLLKYTNGLISLSTTYMGNAGLDWADGVVVSPSSELWVVGFSSDSTNAPAPAMDLVLLRYQSDGQTLLSINKVKNVITDGDTACDVLGTPSGFYVASDATNALGTNKDLALWKFDYTGATIFSKKWHSIPGDIEQFHGMGMDMSGDLYLGGWIGPDSGPGHGAVWKYASDGTLHYAQHGGQDPVRSLSLGGTDMWMAVNSSAPLKWLGGSTLSGAEGLEGEAPAGTFSGDFSQTDGAIYDAGDMDMPQGVAVDTFTVGGPFVYVVGTSSKGANSEIVTAKYDASGSKLAAVSWPISGTDAISGFVDVNPNGVYVSLQEDGVGWRTVKYNKDLGFVSSALLPGDAANRAIVLDRSGNVFVAGSQDPDAGVVKYNKDLVFQSSAVFNTGYYDEAQDVEVDAAGNVYMVGFKLQGTATSYFMAKYNNNLIFQSSATFSAFAHVNPEMQSYGLAVDTNSGSVYLVGSRKETQSALLVVKYDSNLVFLASTVYSAAWGGTDGIVDGSGDLVVIGGHDGGASADDWWLVKFNPSLVPLATGTYASMYADEAADMAVDADGQFYVTGFSFNGSDFASGDFRTKTVELIDLPPPPGPKSYDFTGGFQTGAQIASTNYDQDYVERIVVDPDPLDPAVYAFFKSTTEAEPSGSPQDNSIAKYSMTGVFLASAAVPYQFTDRAFAMGDSMIYLGVQSGGQNRILRYDRSLTLQGTVVSFPGDVLGAFTDFVPYSTSLYAAANGGDSDSGAKLLHLLSADLSEVDRDTFTFAASGREESFGLTLFGTDFYMLVYSTVTGQTRLVKEPMSFTGATSALLTSPSTPTHIVVTATGVYVAGLSAAGDSVQIHQYDHSLSLTGLDTTLTGVSGGEPFLGTNGSGDIYLGYTNQYGRFTLRRMNKDLQFIAEVASESESPQALLDVKVRNSTSVFMAGAAVTGAGNNLDGFIEDMTLGMPLDVSATDIAPANIPKNGTAPMLRLDLSGSAGPVEFDSLRLALRGDALPSNVTAQFYRDVNGSGILDVGDFLLSSTVFSGAYPEAALLFAPQTVSLPPVTYFVSIQFSSMSAGSQVGVAIDDPYKFGLLSGIPGSGDYPIESSQPGVELLLAAKPADGGYPTPVSSGTYRSGGFDTGMFVNAGQDVEVTSSGTWTSGVAVYTATGTLATGGVAGLRLYSLMGRIGSGPWLQLSTHTIFSSTYSGTLFLAMNDADYSDNAGSISIDFHILSAAATKVWVGSSAFGPYADKDENWLGGVKPFAGDSVVFDGAHDADCYWNIYGGDIALLEMTTSYTGTVRLYGPQAYGDYNYLDVSSHVYVRGGMLDLGSNKNLQIQGGVTVEAGGTLSMGDGYTHLQTSKKGVLVRNGGKFLSLGSQWNVIEPMGSDRVPFQVQNATIDVNNYPGRTQFDHTAGVDISSDSHIAAFHHVSFQEFGYNPNPALTLRLYNRVVTMQDVEFRENVSTNVYVAWATTSSRVDMLDAFGPNRGTPRERDPYNVVFWNPDGGGAGDLSGTLSYSGSQNNGLFWVVVSTSPKVEFGALMAVSTHTTAGAFNFTGLPAPNTWYVFGFRDVDGSSEPNGFEPLGGYNHAGAGISDPVFVAAGGNVTSKNVTAQDQALILGHVTNNSAQIGPIRLTALASGTTEAMDGTEYNGDYSLYVRGGMSFKVFGWVDVDNDGEYDTFEASGSVNTGTLTPMATAYSQDFTVSGGSAAAEGGVVMASASSAHPGFLGHSGAQGMLKLKLCSVGNPSKLGGMKLDLTSPNPGGWSLRAYLDQSSTGTFEPGFGDPEIGMVSLGQGASAGVLPLYQPLDLQQGTTQTLFIALSPAGTLGREVELSLMTSAYFSLSQGAMAVQPGYPLRSSTATIRYAVQASTPANPSGGGQDTGFSVSYGQRLTIQAAGSWTTDSYDPQVGSVGPQGYPGTDYYSTVLYEANRGELIGRVGEYGSWFRVGASTMVTASSSGDLFLAMNDYEWDYYNNSGLAYVGFGVSGSTTGAVEGQVYYSGAVTTNNLVVRAMRRNAPEDPLYEVYSASVPMNSGAAGVGVTTYTYALPQMNPGYYWVGAFVVDDPTHKGGLPNGFYVNADSTQTDRSFPLALGVGVIEGNISYTGIMNFGQYVVVAATTSNWEREVSFLGNKVQAASGTYTLSDLPAPNSYYLAAFLDGNYDGEPDGPEPLSVYTVDAATSVSMSNFGQKFNPVFVAPSGSSPSINFSLIDRSAISVDATLQGGLEVSADIVFVAGHGDYGTPAFEKENSEYQWTGPRYPGETLYANLDLLRPATDYSVFVFVDSDRDGVHDLGEAFGRTATPVSVSGGQFANAAVTVSSAAQVGVVPSFTGTSLSAAQLSWTWGAVPGVTYYELLTSAGGRVGLVAAPTTSYVQDVLGPNTYSSSSVYHIRGWAGVQNGSTSSFAGAPLASLARAPVSLTSDFGVGRGSVTLSWGANGNPADTAYEVWRATVDLAGSFILRFSTLGASATDYAVAPLTDYHYKVRARNRNGVDTVYTNVLSTRTPAADVDSIAGRIYYNGSQSGSVVVQASTAIASFSGGMVLPASADQPYFLEIPAGGSYYVRAFVDVDGDRARDAFEDNGSHPSLISVSSATSGWSFSIARDTVPPAAPAGLQAWTSLGRVDLSWSPPTLNKDNTALRGDLAAIRVLRATSTAGPFVTVSTQTVYGATGTVSASTNSFADLSPVGGVDNIYRLVALDYGLNESPVSPSIAKKPMTGGTISGSVRSFESVSSTRPYRVRLSRSPRREDAYVAESSLDRFEFTGLADGVYYLRGYKDEDLNFIQSASTEPSGTHGGINMPFPINIAGGNTISSRTVTLCSRSTMTVDQSGFAWRSGSLDATDCRALDRSQGHYTDLYTLHVGDGEPGSVGRGATIQLSMWGTSYPNALILLGPNGNVAASNSDPYGSYIEYQLPQDSTGLYIIEPTSFDAGMTGYYELELRVVGWSGEGLSGTINYQGASTGTVYVQLFDSTDPDAWPFYMQELHSSAFTLQGIPDKTVYLRAFMDVYYNGMFNRTRDMREPSGAYGPSAYSLTPITIQGGVVTPNDITVTLTDPLTGTVSGLIDHTGTAEGDFRVSIGRKRCPDCSDMEIDPVAYQTIPTTAPSYNYTLPFIPAATDYILNLFLDVNANGWLDGLESGASSKPVSVSGSSTTTVNLAVRDMGTGPAGNSTIEGTLSYDCTDDCKSGTVLIGFASDESFNYMPYYLVQASTGFYSMGGVAGNATYYYGAFIDVNGNGTPDEGAEPMTGQSTSFFVPTYAIVEKSFSLRNPPDGVITGTVSYSGSMLGDIMVQGWVENWREDGGYRQTRIPRTAGISSYTYALEHLAATTTWRVSAWVDTIANMRSDFGEPSFWRESIITVSSGAAAPGVHASSTLISMTIFDADSGGTGDRGILAGWVDYQGSQPGPVVVQAFTTNTFTGQPYREVSVGPPYQFRMEGLPDSTYFLRAYKDSNNNWVHDAVFESSGSVNGGSGVTITQDTLVFEGLTTETPLQDIYQVSGSGLLSLSGTVRVPGTALSTGTLRVLLFQPGGQAPVRMSSYTYNSSVSSMTAYSFTELEPGQYFVRAFLDNNGNFYPDTSTRTAVASEPMGSYVHTGLFLAESRAGVDFDLCDRTYVDASTSPIFNSRLTGTDCRDLGQGGTYGSGTYAQVYSFYGQRGQEIIAVLEGLDFYDSYLSLRDPFGGFVSDDDDSAGGGNARLQVQLQADGYYNLMATSKAEEMTGGYRLSFQRAAGTVGSISGEVRYTGSQGGRIVVALFSTSSFDTEGSFVAAREFDGPSPFMFESLPTGVTYYIGGFVDVNYNYSPDLGEDSSAFGADPSSPDPLELRSGQDISGIIFEIQRSSLVVTAAGIAGTVKHASATVVGTVRLEFWSDGQFLGMPAARRDVPTDAPCPEGTPSTTTTRCYPYDVSLQGGMPYYIKAYLDLDNDFMPDPEEPQGVYAPRGQGAEPVYTSSASIETGRDFYIFEPGMKEGSTVAGGEGVVTLSTSGVYAGSNVSQIAATLVVGKSGIATDGRIVMGVPQSWQWPTTTVGGDGEVVATAEPGGITMNVAVPPGQPVAEITPPSALLSGSTVTITYKKLWVPCYSPDAMFFFATQSAASANPDEKPLPLFSGQPRIEVRPGTARNFYLRNGQTTLTKNTTSEALVLEGWDQCGQRAGVDPAIAFTTVTLRAKHYDYTTGAYSEDPNLSITKSTTSPDYRKEIADLVLQAGQSTTYFFALAAGTLTDPNKVVEIHWPLYNTTSYAWITVVSSDIITNVRVSTVPYGTGTSATIQPDGNPLSPKQAYVNFDLEQEMGWQVMVSSMPYKSGVEPNPVWQTWGYSQPSMGQVAWDGRYSPWINNGSLVPKATYFIRIDVGNGVRNDNLRVSVRSAQLVGDVYDLIQSTALSNPLLAGVRVNAYGRYGSGSAETASDGRFVLAGLGAGSYFMDFQRDGYLLGKASVTINADAKAFNFALPDSNIFMSSTTAGALKVYMRRAPALLVFASMTATDVQNEELWGGLEVANAVCGSTAPATLMFHAPLHVNASTNVVDNGSQWDPIFKEYSRKEFVRFDIPAGTYSVRAYLPGFDSLCTSGTVVFSGERVVTLPAFERRKFVEGSVTLENNAETYNASGMFVSVSAVPTSTTVARSSGAAYEQFYGVFIPPGQKSGAYRLEGLWSSDLWHGTYTLTANVQGFQAKVIGNVDVSTNPIVHFSTFTKTLTDHVITGTARVTGNTTLFPFLDGVAAPALRVHLNAWAPGSLNMGYVSVDIPQHATQSDVPFTITGVDAGLEYQVFAYLEHRSENDFDVLGGFPKKVLTSAVDGTGTTGTIEFAASSGVISGTIILPDTQRDFGNVGMSGKVIASVHPDRVGSTFEEATSTGMPNFLCGDGSGAADPATGECPAGVSSATFKVLGQNTQTMDVTFNYKTTGKMVTARVSVANGATTTAVVDLRGDTYELGGRILNQVSNTSFNTAAKVYANAAEIPLVDSRGSAVVSNMFRAEDGARSTATLARVIAVRQEFGQYNVALSTWFDKNASRVAYMTQAGSFTFRNMPPGGYTLRTEDLRTCPACDTIVPKQVKIVKLTANTTTQDITLLDGYDVSGRISLANNKLDSVNLRLEARNRRQELVRSTSIALGNSFTGAATNYADYTIINLPAREFYTLAVIDTSGTPKYVGRPVKFPDPGLSPNGLQNALSNQNVTLYQAGYFTGKLKDSNTGELIRDRNATLLAPNFSIVATANPWVEGGFAVAAASASGRPIRADGTFLVGPLIPQIPFDLRLGQDKFDLAYLARGSQNYTPVVLGGQMVQPGELKDMGTIGLSQGQSIEGFLVDSASTMTALGNIKVTAKPSFGTVDINVETFTSLDGKFRLWVSTAVSRLYDLTVAPRDGNVAAGQPPRRYLQKRLLGVEASTAPLATVCPTASTAPMAVVCLDVITSSVTAFISTPTGGSPLSYPFGDNKGFPAAAIFMQKNGVVPRENPLGDIQAVSEADGSFVIPGLAASTTYYTLRAVSLGYRVYEATVAVTSSGSCIFRGSSTAQCLTNLTLEPGAQVTGRIVLAGGSYPSQSEAAVVAAGQRKADGNIGELIIGQVEVDPNARLVTGYTINGFKNNILYDIVIIADNGKDMVAPVEGVGVYFTDQETSTVKTINLTYNRVAPDCSASQQALGNNQFKVKIECTQPLRNTDAADKDLDVLVTRSTCTSKGVDLVSPDGTGQLLGTNETDETKRKRFSDESRKQITVVYRSTASEAFFSIRLGAYFATVDPTTGGNYAIDRVFDFSTGFHSSVKETVANMQGGQVKLERSQDDEDNNRDERFEANIQAGTFEKCVNETALGCEKKYDTCGNVIEGGTSPDYINLPNAQLGIMLEAYKSMSSTDCAAAQGALTQRYGCKAGMVSAEAARAASSYEAMASAQNLNPMSAYYRLFLPLGIRTQLNKPVDLTFSYDQTALDRSTKTVDDLNVWYFKGQNTTCSNGQPARQGYCLETQERRVDQVNKTLTVKVDHMSTFVLLGEAPALTGDKPFSGSDIQVWNFPNPFDCTQKTKASSDQVFTAAPQQTFSGTRIRVGLPASSERHDLRIRIYNVAGELVREIDAGDMPGGLTTYVSWGCLNDSGQNVASGVYIGQVDWGGRKKFFKMALIKGSGL